MAEIGSSDESFKIAILDVETTGLDVKINRIIQIACLVTDEKGNALKLYETYINPEGDLTRVTQSPSYKIHKINEDILRSAPTFKQKSSEILELLSDIDILAGYNPSFDFDFLRNEFLRVDQIDQSMNEEESDESWNLEAFKREVPFKSNGVITKFDELKFKLLDVFRLALIAFPNQGSYRLSSIANYLKIKVRRFNTTGYRWDIGASNGEEELKVNEKVEVMQDHNSITDVLVTGIILKKCLEFLKIEYVDIINGRHRQYEISKDVILTASKLVEKVPTKEELIELARLAPEQMNINFPDRSRKLKNMRSSDISKVISFLSTRKQFSDKRQKMLCQGFLYIVSDKDLLSEFNMKICEENKIINSKSPAKDRSINSAVKEAQCSLKVTNLGEGKDKHFEISKEKLQNIRISEAFPPLQAKRKRSRSDEDGNLGVNPLETATGDEEGPLAKRMKEEKDVKNVLEIKVQSQEASDIVIDQEKTLEYDAPDDSEVHSQDCTAETDDTVQVTSGQNEEVQQEDNLNESEEFPFDKKPSQETPEKDAQKEEQRKKALIFSPSF